MVRASLKETADQRLQRSRSFAALDRSEKGGVSFFLGLVLTKLIAEKLFEVPWLLHLDVYRQQLNPQFWLPERPDFVGQDAMGRWLVVESKGRYGGIPSALLDRAKRQTSSILTIAGQSPTLTVAVGTGFWGGGLSARLRDPETPGPAGVDLELGREEQLRAYYRPIVELSETPGLAESLDVTLRGRRFRRTPLAGMDATIAVDQRVLDWYRTGLPPVPELLRELNPHSVLSDLESVRRHSRKEPPPKVPHDPERERLETVLRRRLTDVRRTGPDGVLVELGASWDMEYMRREPEDRTGR
jgi:hypothetical protein